MLARALIAALILGALAAGRSAAGPASSVPVSASADADTRGFTAHLEAQGAAWAAYRDSLGGVRVQVRAFTEEYASYRALLALTDPSAREREAARRFGWGVPEARDRLRAFDAVMARLTDGPFAGAIDRASGDLDRMWARAAVTVNAMEFALEESPAPAGADPLLSWRALAGSLTQAARALDAQSAHLPSSPAIYLWAQTLPQAAARLETALAGLERAVGEFPRDPLCAHADQWVGARRAFAESKAPSGGRPPCEEFLLTGAFPRVRKPVWESGGMLFFYDPDEKVGRLADRARAMWVYRRYPLLKDAPPLTPAWLTLRAAALDPAAVARARALHDRFQGWRGEAGPDPRILIGLGLVQSAREILRLDAETFSARYLLEPPFTARVTELLNADEKDGYATGRVRDALTGAPVIAARIVFEAEGRTTLAVTDTAGAYAAVFPRAPGASMRVTVTRDGFQTLTHAGPPPSPVLVPYDFKLSRVPDRFALSGIVVGKGSGKSVENAVVIAAPARGTAARVYTGGDGRFRLVVDAAPGTPVELRAQKGDAGCQVKVSAEGAERTGLRLLLEAKGAGEIAQVWEVDDEGGMDSPEAEPEEPATPAVTKSAPAKSKGRASAAKPKTPAGKKPAEPAARPATETPAAVKPAPPAETLEPKPPVAGPTEAEPSATPPVVASTVPWIHDGPPARQSGALGNACADRGGTLEIVPIAGSFPDTVRPGTGVVIEARIEARPPGGAPEALRVTVHARCLDAPPQTRELVFTGPGAQTVTFTFVALGALPADAKVLAGVTAAYAVPCGMEEPGTRFAAMLQRYARR